MDKYLIDNNVISNYFSNAFSERATSLLAKLIDEVPNLSVITKIEALSWRSPNLTKENIVRIFVNSSNIIPLTDTIVEKCIDIRRNCKVKTPDAIIAATALVKDFILLTSDSDFNRIPNLKVINPFNW
jgi:predicted nucleic acid-binding protein